MSQKTEPIAADSTKELSNEYLVSLVVASAFVLLLVFLGPVLLVNPLAVFHIEGAGPVPLLYPWIIAGTQTIGNGLTEFSGSSLGPVSNAMLTTCLLSILFSGILAPTLTLLLMGRQRSAVSRGLYLVCLIITVTLAITVLPSGYIAYKVRLSLRAAQAEQTNRDFIINNLNTIAWKIREYRIVPKALGGGEGGIDGYVLPRSLAETEDATYTVRPAAPGTSLRSVPVIATIHAYSKRYPGSEVDVALRADGQLWSWSYTGVFQ